MKCCECEECCTIVDADSLTARQLREKYQEWKFANIASRKDGTIIAGQVVAWCPCCKQSQNCNG